MSTTNRVLRYASYLQDYCQSHEFCHGCKLPKTEDENCICPRKWIIPEIYSYPEIISNKEFEKLFISDTSLLYKKIGQFRVNVSVGKIDKNKSYFWTIDALKYPNSKFIGVKFEFGEIKIASFSEKLDCKRFLSGWSEMDIEDFKEFEKEENK